MNKISSISFKTIYNSLDFVYNSLEIAWNIGPEQYARSQFNQNWLL